jgi:hypothetical protein
MIFLEQALFSFAPDLITWKNEEFGRRTEMVAFDRNDMFMSILRISLFYPCHNGLKFPPCAIPRINHGLAKGDLNVFSVMVWQDLFVSQRRCEIFMAEAGQWR